MEEGSVPLFHFERMILLRVCGFPLCFVRAGSNPANSILSRKSCSTATLYREPLRGARDKEWLCYSNLPQQLHLGKSIGGLLE